MGLENARNGELGDRSRQILDSSDEMILGDNPCLGQSQVFAIGNDDLDPWRLAAAIFGLEGYWHMGSMHLRAGAP